MTDLSLTYLTTDKLKEFTPISANVDVSQLSNWIPVSETMHIVTPILGVALDTELKQQIASNTVTADNQILIDNICQASAWFSFYESSVFLRTKAMNKGIVQQFSENSQVASDAAFNQYRQELRDKAVFFTNYLIDFLELKKDTYPLYRSQGCNSNQWDTGSGIYIG